MSAHVRDHAVLAALAHDVGGHPAAQQGADRRPDRAHAGQGDVAAGRELEGRGDLVLLAHGPSQGQGVEDERHRQGPEASAEPQ